MDDVYYSSVVFFKTGKFSTQQCWGEIKFESMSGPKRIDFSALQHNGSCTTLGQPLGTIPLTHVLAVNIGKQPYLSRGRYMFQIITTSGQYQVGAATAEDRAGWMERVKQMCSQLPVTTRTYVFPVIIHPTAHSDRLRLRGEYVLKVTPTKLRLFTSNGTLHTRFYLPLEMVEKVHSSVLSNRGLRGGYGTQSLLIVSTMSSSPVGSGGFVFATESAADIVSVISQRRNAILEEMRSETTPTAQPDHPAGNPNTIEPTLKNTSDNKEQIENEKAGKDSLSVVEKRAKFFTSKFKGTSQSLYTPAKSRDGETGKTNSKTQLVTSSSFPKRRRSKLNLFLGPPTPPRRDRKSPTPDDPYYISHSEIDRMRMLRRDTDEAVAAEVKHESLDNTSTMYYNGEFLNALRIVQKIFPATQGVGDNNDGKKENAREDTRQEAGEDEGRRGGEIEAKEDEEEEGGRRGGEIEAKEDEEEGGRREEEIVKTKSLQRQPVIDVLSPDEEEIQQKAEVSRPRSYAFLNMRHSEAVPLSSMYDTKMKQSQSFYLDGRLNEPPSNPLTKNRQISCSNPELNSINSPSSSHLSPISPNHDYLLILPSFPEPAKAVKKPMPTPRTRVFSKPPIPQPRSKRNPSAPEEPQEHRPIPTQRSLSELNFHNAHMVAFSDNSQKPAHNNTQGQVQSGDRDRLRTPVASRDELDIYSNIRHSRLFRQKSGSTGDLRKSCVWGRETAKRFAHTEVLYENGEQYMDNWMYGIQYQKEEDEEEEDRFVYTETLYENGQEYMDNWMYSSRDKTEEDEEKEEEEKRNRFAHTEELYGNGQQYMDYWMYGTQDLKDEEKEGTEKEKEEEDYYCTPWDSGIEYSPNSSPLPIGRSFSAERLNIEEKERLRSRGDSKHSHSDNEEERRQKPTGASALSLPPLPFSKTCSFVLRAKTRPRDTRADCHHERFYENFPLFID